MKKPIIEIILLVITVICVGLTGASAVQAVRTQTSVQTQVDRSQLAILKKEEEVEESIKEQEAAEREARQKALDEKLKAQSQEELEASEETTDDLSEEDSERTDWSNAEDTSTTATGKIVGIDPGHQGSWVDMSALEPNAPGSGEMKARCTTGTTGNYTGIPEYQLNLDVSLKLRDVLQDRGYTVVMTRENNDANISNAERAQLVTASGADIYVRVHANSSDDTGVAGALTMCPSQNNPYVGNLHSESKRLSETILSAYCAATGIGNRGVMLTDTMTGINWSTMPVTIVEMGFMSNQSDDTTMADSAFQEKMAEGIANGIDAYFAQ